MKRTMKKMLSFGLVAAMSLTMLAGCGNSKDATNDTNVSNGQEEKKPTGDVKIGVLVQDVSGEEALGFRSYYENYIADQYGVTFTYTDELKDAASEKSAIEKFASQGYQIWLLRLSTESPTSSQFNARNRSVRAPNVSTSVVQIGVKSAGWLNRITHLPL